MKLILTLRCPNCTRPSSVQIKEDPPGVFIVPGRFFCVDDDHELLIEARNKVTDVTPSHRGGW